MKEKIEKLEKLRTQTEKLDPRMKDFPGNLKDISQEALGYCEEPGDEQEVHWLKSAIRTAESMQHNSEVSNEAIEERQTGLTYLKEAIDSILIRERKYL